MLTRQLSLIFLLLGIAGSFSAAAPPRVTHERYQLELVASEPEIVTPVGMTFDRAGRLLVIESHTHQPPEKYSGPKHDRIRMLSDSDGDGKLDRWSTFAEGFRHSMNLLARKDGAVYLVTRGSLLLLRDTDDDGVADKQDVLLRLETEDDYPHNALGGIDETPEGFLVIGLGENHGLPFKLVGADGKTISATGGLDGFFRCTAEGKNIEHIARGVWNPFSLCVVPRRPHFRCGQRPGRQPAVPAYCMSWRVATTAISINMAAPARTRCNRGTVSCPARCRWSAALAKRRRQLSITPAACG